MPNGSQQGLPELDTFDRDIENKNSVTLKYEF